VDVPMLEHHAIVERLHASFSACLPARYPSRVDDEAALRVLLEKHEQQLLKSFERVRGRTELAVTAVWTAAEQEAAPLTEASPGKSYLLQRQREFAAADAERRRAAAVAEKLEALLAPLAVETERALVPRAGVAVSIAVLVERQNEAAVRDRIDSGGERDGVRILVSGPWPPYSFARIGMGVE
jgi:Gas vesicle synthesis protein GvpL/GvpF